jgi:hypothetical protein
MQLKKDRFSVRCFRAIGFLARVARPRHVPVNGDFGRCVCLPSVLERAVRRRRRWCRRRYVAYNRGHDGKIDYECMSAPARTVPQSRRNLTFVLQGIQPRLCWQLFIEVRKVQISPVMRQSNESPRRGHTSIESFARDRSCVCAVVHRLRKPGALKQAPDTLLFNKLKSFVTELVADLSVCSLA